MKTKKTIHKIFDIAGKIFCVLCVIAVARGLIYNPSSLVTAIIYFIVASILFAIGDFFKK